MDTAQFLGRILPANGVYFIVRTNGRGLLHQACASIAEAAQFAHAADSQGMTVYHACAAYRQAEVVDAAGKIHWRQHSNVRALKAFWMDLDVGNDPKKYPTQSAALDALLDFCIATKLPVPMVVSSGGGLHAYWTLTHELIPEQWRVVAEGLKALSSALDLKSDPACTSDPARILRPVGTAHRKDIRNPRWVELVTDSTDIAPAEFARIVKNNLADRKIQSAERVVRDPVAANEKLNAEYEVKRDFPPCSAEKVADRCTQLRLFRDAPATLSEPHLYGAIQLMIHGVEGDELIHTWAAGHPNYNRASGFIDKKIAQLRGQGIGPTLCTTFASRNPAGCDNCPFKGKVSSPAQLGTVIEAKAAPVTESVIDGVKVTVTLPDPPHGFTRGASGGIYFEDADGITHKVYEHDLFPVELAMDEQLGYETVRWRHHLPLEGWKEFVIRSSLVCRPVEFEAAMRDNHIKPLIRSKLPVYADAYMRTLQEKKNMRQLFKAQGWKADTTQFVLGDKLYKKDGVVDAGFSHGTGKFLQPFHTKGSAEKWKALTWSFGHSGFEPMAYMLALAFAPPLLAMDNWNGFTVCALGPSGAGKSTSAQVMCSVFGHPDSAWIGKNDSRLAAYQRLGAHCNLITYMDEGTTIESKDLRELIYEIPTGKSRTTMKADYSLRQGAEWSTILVTSSNDSWQAKLSLEKAHAEAESLRLFEYDFPRNPEFGPIAQMIPGVVHENYGHAGAEYIRRLVAERDAIREDLRVFIKNARADFGTRDEERFWLLGAALPLYGALLAHRWGIIDFDPNVLRPWLSRELMKMRGVLADTESSPVAVFSEYLNQHVGERVVVSDLNSALLPLDRKPYYRISQRLERSKNLLWVSKHHVYDTLGRLNVNVNNLRDRLMQLGVLIDANAKKTLGAGTELTGGRIPCWLIKADHPELIGSGAEL